MKNLQNKLTTRRKEKKQLLIFILGGVLGKRF
jgi:hypothetical protein